MNEEWINEGEGEREKGSGVCIYNKWEMFPYDNNKYNSQHMKQKEHNES